MMRRLLVGTGGILMLLVVGWGCARSTPSIPLEGGSGGPESAVQGSTDVVVVPDGKGGEAFEMCVSTEGEVSGEMNLFAANATQNDWAQFFTSTPVAIGEAGQELCGPLDFDIESGDKLLINGSWSNGTRWLVDGSTKGGHDYIKEIWIDDQFYEIGKDCVYQGDKRGYDLRCTVR